MRQILAPVTAALAAAAASWAAAQQPPAQQPQQPPPAPPSLVDNGFFRPYPYPSLQAPVPPQGANAEPFLGQSAPQPYPHWSTQQAQAPAPDVVSPTQVAAAPQPAAAVVEPYSAVTSPEAPGNQRPVAVAPNGQAATAPAPAPASTPAAPAPVMEGTPVPAPSAALERVERQMDRVESVNEEAARTAPVDATAGFTGTTSERNR